MAKIMIGTEEVSKIMMGTEEVSLLSMGGETIPISGSPAPTPSYTAYDYIQTDGFCWFETGIIPENTTEFELVKFTPLQNAHNWQVYIGRSSTDMDVLTRCVFKSNERGGKYEVVFGDAQSLSKVSYNVGQEYNVKMNISGLTIDGVQRIQFTSTGLTAGDTHTLWIGAENNDNATTGNWAAHRASAAIFGEVKIWTGGVLVADLVPAEYQGSIGFWDTVANTFRPNLGTGTPIASNSQ